MAIERSRKELLVSALREMHLPNLPDHANLVGTALTNQLNWEPTINLAPNQSVQSLEEQQGCLQLCLQAADQFRLENHPFVRGVIMIGPPGAG